MRNHRLPYEKEWKGDKEKTNKQTNKQRNKKNKVGSRIHDQIAVTLFETRNFLDSFCEFLTMSLTFKRFAFLLLRYLINLRLL